MSRFLSVAVLLVFACPAWAQIDVGSDGSDGVFNPLANVTFDLSLAASLCDCDGGGMLNDPCRWDCPSPVEGQGVYDADQWAVVFKYGSVNIPAGVTVTYGTDPTLNHPSRAPVVWLVDGAVIISGTIVVDGSFANNAGGYAEPGPGGFRGGRGGFAGVSRSAGFGPGGGDTSSSTADGGSYATLGRFAPAGATYGNAAILPLIGGSGGNGNSSSAGKGGGAGGGALLIAARTSVSIASTAQILARGGSAAFNSGTAGGSGGAIRLVADDITIDGALRATGGAPGFGNGGGLGRIRVEANTFSATDFGDPLFVQDLPTFAFPPDASPKLRAMMLEDIDMNQHTVPGDPDAIITDNTMTDVNIATPDMVTVHIEAENIPPGTCVDVRVVSASGPTTVDKSSPLVPDPTKEMPGRLTATADVIFPAGFSVVQLRAFFADDETNCPVAALGMGDLNTLNGERIVKAVAGSTGRELSHNLPPTSDKSGSDGLRPARRTKGHPQQNGARAHTLRDLKTLNGERIVKVEVRSTMGGGSSKLVYITETGRKIPVG